MERVRFHITETAAKQIEIVIIVDDIIHTITTNLRDALNQAYLLGQKEKEIETKCQFNS